VTPSDRAAAQSALSEGRAVYGRLDQIRGPEDAAADIMDLWGVAETAMRAMLGGSTLAGQGLVRELRQRGVLNLEQANAIASFWDARTRVDDVAYKPTLTDVGFARAGYNELSRVANEPPVVTQNASNASSTSSFAPGGAAASPGNASNGASTGASRGAGVGAAAAAASAPRTTGFSVDEPTAGTPRAATRSRTLSRPMMIGAGVILVVIIAAAAAFFMRNGNSKFNSEMSNAVDLMTTGRAEAARAAFGAIAHEYPDRAEPHVFLSRLARSDTPPDMNTARQELVTAIRLDPAYEPAQREMGIFQLADHNPSLARNFLIRAAQLNPADSAAQGYLGCALMGLNRAAEAQKFFARAGTGTWSSCVTIQPNPAAPAGP
jgi:hypothetical protein